MLDIKNNNAFCILPWIHTYFSPDGKVSLCCISTPLLHDSRNSNHLNIQTHSLDEIFRSDAYKVIRHNMLNGVHINHCIACYNEENNGGKSHRLLYNELWLDGKYKDLGLLNKIQRAGVNNIVDSPLSVDFRLGNLCNLECQICNQQNSSRIEKNIEFSNWNPASYLRLKHRFNDAVEWYESDELKNEIVEVGESVRFIKLAGGEPTINKSLIHWLEHLVSTGKSKQIELAISTNFTNTNIKFYELLENFESVRIGLSIDGYSELNDYLRYPSKWSAILKNVEYIRDLKNRGAPINVLLTPVINIYNALDIVDLFEWAEEKEFEILALEVRGVPQIDCNLIPPDTRQLIKERLASYLQRSKANSSNQSIISLIKKISEPFDEKYARNEIARFYKFTDFIDSGRKLKFDQVCPEMNAILSDYYHGGRGEPSALSSGVTPFSENLSGRNIGARMGADRRSLDGESTRTVESLLSEALANHQAGRIFEAIKQYQEIMKLDALNFDAIYLQGVAASQLGQFSLSEKLLQLALKIKPGSEDALIELGHLNKAQGNNEAALGHYLKTLQSHPQSIPALMNAASMLFEMGRLQEAMSYCQVVLSFDPAMVAALILKGRIHNRFDELHYAQECFDKANHFSPDNTEILHELAFIKMDLGLPDEALPYFFKILSINPEHKQAVNAILLATQSLQANVSAKEEFYNSGLIEQAEILAREDTAIEDSVENNNFLLKCYLVSNRHTARDYYEVVRDWSRRHAQEERLPSPRDFRNDRSPHRRLRVGIVGDYFPSVIGAFTLYPLFRSYDRAKLELYCYNFGPGGESLRPIIDCYRDIQGYSNDEFFDQVRQDVVDIMLDINGRIRTPNYFAALLRQPAPIQVNWYNLPCTVGVKAYNYAISNSYSIRDKDGDIYCEKIFKVPTGVVCGTDMGRPPVVPSPPCERNGFVTFGCFGDFFKVNETVLGTWADLLARVPESRLYLKSNNLRMLSERTRVSEFFERRGVAAERLILEGLSPYEKMKKCYEWVDIALDTFPYSSGSTTINALWQGVPVLTIEGPDWRGRTTASNLVVCGLQELIAADVADYLVKAETLATDRTKLVEYRATLGQRLFESPMCDVKRFSRDFEHILREMWLDWLADQ